MSDVQQRDFYQVLGIGYDADSQEIERAYQRLVGRHDSSAQQMSFIEEASSKGLIQEAYETLSNNARREAYDRQAMAKTPSPRSGPATAVKPPLRRKSSLFSEPEGGEKKKKPNNVYQDYFGFTEKPFDLTPDPKYLYLSPKHKEVLAHLVYGMQENNGFLKIVGEVGTGKTTLCRSFLRELRADFNIAYIFNPSINALELLQSINAELGLPAISDSKKELTDILNNFLLEQRKSGHRVVVIIDEAQDLDPGVLEQLRLISNLETETEKLIQIVLIGQPELDKHLAKEELRQLRQRIAVQWELLPLNLEETRGYIQHRLNVAMGRGKAHFTHRAMELIYQYSQGIPRMINVLADRALLVAYTLNVKKIGGKVIHLAAKDVGGMKRPASWTRIFWKILAPAAAVGAVAFSVVDWISIPNLNSGAGDGRDIRKMIQENAVVPPSDEGRLIPQETPVPATDSAPPPETAQTASPPPALPQEAGKTLEEERGSPKTAVDASPLVFSKTESVATYLSSLSLMDSKVEAAKWLLDSWGILPENLVGLDEKLFDRLQAEYGLSEYELHGDFKRLAAFNYPAILEIALPNAQGTKYLALTKLRGDSGVFGSSDRMEIPLKVVDPLWNRKAILFWRDFEKLPEKFGKGFQGKEAIWLQKNLRLLGFFQGREASLYGQKTVDAVLNFQRRYNIKDDGRFDVESKIMLYNLLNIYPAPKLTS